MLRGNGRTLDIFLLLTLLVLSVIVLALFALPEPPAQPALPATETLPPSPTATASPTLPPVPTLRPTLTPSETPTVSPTPTPTTAATQLPTAPPPTAPPGSTATPLPLVAGGALLPHNALFTRRHNDFSQPSAAGVEGLGEQGVTIAGTDIVFPTFEPLSGTRVPDPDNNRALSISYGLSAIPLTHKRDERATHYLEVALKADPGTSTASAGDRLPPANYVFVIDTSGSMAGTKLNGVLTAIRALYSEMRPEDSIGIVDFDTQVRSVLPATQVAELSLAALNGALRRLVAEGGTDIGLGLDAGIAEAASFVGGSAVSHVFLFSDGNPTDGVTEWLQLRTGMVEAVRNTPIRVSTFAFGDDANDRELDALAGVTGGSFNKVTNPAALGEHLAGELMRREFLVAKNVRLRVDIDPALSIVHLYGHDQVGEPIARAALEPGPGEVAGPQFAVGTEGPGLQIYVPDLAAGETYWVVFEIAVPDVHSQAIGQATASYVDTATGASAEDTVVLTLGTSIDKLAHDLVVRHALGLWSSDVALYAIDDITQGDLATAAARLRTHVGALETAYGNLPAVWLGQDLETLRNMASLAEALETGGLGTRTTASARSLLLYALDAFGRARSGFTQTTTGTEP